MARSLKCTGGDADGNWCASAAGAARNRSHTTCEEQKGNQNKKKKKKKEQIDEGKKRTLRNCMK